MKNVVMIAFDCDPYLESESLESFKIAYFMSRQGYNITMITRPQFKDDIEKFLLKAEPTNLRFVYVDSKKYSLRYSKAKGFLKSFTLSKYIDDFFVNVKKELHKIESIHSIDIIHKVTPNSYRKAIDLSEFNNATRVYGPCGGAQETPHFLFKSLSFSARFSEYAHRYINHKTLKSNCFRVAINSYDHVLCTNIETKEAIDPLLISHQDCTVLTDVGIDTLACFEECKPAPKVFTLLWIGRMIPRKGLSIFFDALKLVYCNYHVILVGDGPERKKLVRKVKKAGLSSKVTFIGRVDHCEVMNFYRLANLFVFPSLRESGGNVVLESISQGVPVMAFNQGGAPVILGKAGIYLSVCHKKYDDIVNEMASQITHFITYPNELDKYRLLSLNQAQKLSWSMKVKKIEDIYEERNVDSGLPKDG